MAGFLINGGRELFGEISVGGSKNAALPIIFACIAVHGVSTLSNIPDISDVDVAFNLLRGFGAEISRCGDTVTVDTRELRYEIPDEKLTSKIRASSYLIGACLARFGKAKIQRFGGCNFDNRPIDMHLLAAESLGASVCGDEIFAERLSGADIRFDKISVGATVNALLLSSSAEGKSRIFGYAREPHVISLVEFLRSAGAEIYLYEDYIEVVGAHLSSASATIITDMIEAGTYLALSLATGSSLSVRGADMCQLDSYVNVLVHSGAVVEYDDTAVCVYGKITDPPNIITAPYPQFPTDLQPQTAALLAATSGGRIKEGVWHNRFGYLSEFSKFGVKYRLSDGMADIESSKILPANTTAPDLRGGAALMILALVARGESRIFASEIIKRGYSDIVNKLLSVGADIKEF